MGHLIKERYDNHGESCYQNGSSSVNQKKKINQGGEDEKKVHKVLHRFVLSIINLMSAEIFSRE